MATLSTNRLGALLVLSLLVCSLVATAGVTASTTVQDDDPETAEEYFDAFRSLDGSEAFESYGELEDVRSFALSKTQIGELSADDRAELEATLELLRAFDRAYQHSEEGAYESSLESAETVDSSITSLESHQQSQATLASLGQNRFYEQLGDQMREAADSAADSPTRIELLSMTATAYERADRPREAAEFDIQAEQLEERFETDRERMNEADERADEVMESCDGCETVTAAVGQNGVDVLGQYATVRSAHSEVREAASLAASHGLDDREQELASAGDDIGAVQTSFALGSIGVLLGYGTVVGLAGTLGAARVFAWRRTFEASRIDSIVPIGDGDE